MSRLAPAPVVILDGTLIASELDLHRTLERQMELGPHYGRNLAALRDRLTADMARPVRLVWMSSDASRARLGDELFARIVRVLTDVAEQDVAYGWDERFEVVLERRRVPGTDESDGTEARDGTEERHVVP